MNELRKLNACEGVANTVFGKDWYRLVDKTCTDIYATLADHCGLLSTNALVVIDDNMGNFNPSIFTKDGIDILNAIDYVSPIQSYIKGHLGYIGSRVDSAAHDGTTTAMMFAAKLLANHFNKCLIDGPVGRIQQREEAAEFVSQLNEVRARLRERVITVDDIMEDFQLTRAKAQGYIAYIQTLITSKGDAKLAECMRTIFEKTPPEMYSYFTYIRESMETNVQYSITQPRGELRVNVIAATNAHFNHALGTEYLQAGCDLIVLTEDFMSGYLEVDKLIAHLEKTTTPTVVLFKKADSSMVQKLSLCNPDIPIIALNYATRVNSANTPIELNAINAIAGATSLHEALEDEYIIHNVTCHVDRGTLIISGLCEVDPDEPMHKWYRDPEANPAYTKLVEELKTQIHKLENTHNGNVQNELMSYIKVLKDMIGGCIPILNIGGRTLDNRAGEPIVKDVLGAITASLEGGFIVDGNMSLYASSSNSPILRTAMLDILSTIHNIPEKAMLTITEAYSEIIDNRYTCLHTANVNKPTTAGMFTELSDTKTSPVIQPAALYDELFERLIEVLPKLMTTSRVIVPGTANL